VILLSGYNLFMRERKAELKTQEPDLQGKNLTKKVRAEAELDGDGRTRLARCFGLSPLCSTSLSSSPETACLSH
jgi:hypothetical protein